MKLYLSRIEYKSFPWIIWKDEGRLLYSYTVSIRRGAR